MEEHNRRGLKQELLNLIEVTKNNVLLEASFEIDLCAGLPADAEALAKSVKTSDGEDAPAVANQRYRRPVDPRRASPMDPRAQSPAPKVTAGPQTVEQQRGDRQASNQQAAAESPKIATLREVQETASKCVKCPLHRTRTNVVFGVGNPDADLMFVGEAPGHYEDVQGEPFVGRAGQLLTKIINAIGMQREEVYIANILKCRPPNNRNPLPEEIVLCSPYLRRQIEIIQPRIICALGAFAGQTLLSSTQPIGALRGRFHEYQGIKLIPTYHPAYLLRNPGEKKKTWEDMKKVRDALKESS